MKVKTFEEKEGVTSWMRVILAIYFAVVAVPGSYILLLSTLKKFTQDNFSWEQVIFSITMFLFLHVIWIAPKTIQKALENKGIIDKMIEKR